MKTSDSLFLPGVPEAKIIMALNAAGGDEIGRGKLASAESSAALAVNAFGWFLDRPADLPRFPVLGDLSWIPTSVDVERQMRFPWKGGRHPWLDAAAETETHLIGVESKRYEPFRDAKSINLSPAYDRDVWGPNMLGYCQVRDQLRKGAFGFVHLDAAQLVKHAYGLVTEGRRLGKAPVLLYLFAEPTCRGSVEIADEAHARHRSEIQIFADAVRGDEVRFEACTYQEWLEDWTGETISHADAIAKRFAPL